MNATTHCSLMLVVLAVGCGSRPPAATVSSRETESPPLAPTPATQPIVDSAPPPPDPDELSNRKDDANRRYDRGDFTGAIDIAEGVLTQVPSDLRMLRVATSAHCVLGNTDRAREHWSKLPERDREQIARRCARFGISLP